MLQNGRVRVAEEATKKANSMLGYRRATLCRVGFFANRTPVNTVATLFSIDACREIFCVGCVPAVCAVTGKQNVIWIESMGVQTLGDKWGKLFLSGNF